MKTLDQLTVCEQQMTVIGVADGELLDALAYVNTVTMIVRSLEHTTRGAEVDDAMHSLLLVADHATSMIKSARNRLEDVEFVDLTPCMSATPIDESGQSAGFAPVDSSVDNGEN